MRRNPPSASPTLPVYAHSLGDRPLKNPLNLLLRWQMRAAERRHLATLDDRLLADQRLSRAAADVEARKPFWRV